MKFTNLQNGNTEECTSPWLWTLLFGPFYFLFKGIWTHAVISLVLSICTFGLSALFYPVFADIIVRNHYLRNGWEHSEDNSPTKWYFKTPIVIIAILSFFPFALPLVWYNPNYKRSTKVIVTIIVVLFTAVSLYLTPYLLKLVQNTISELNQQLELLK